MKRLIITAIAILCRISFCIGQNMTEAQERRSRKSRSNLFKTGFLLILFVVSLTSCGGGAISGTWDLEYQRNSEYPTFVKFSGRSFTMTQFCPGSNDCIFTKDEWEKAKITDILYGHNMSDGSPSYFRYVISNGKYSITNDKIEFILSDGTIRIFDFSRTENTITIDGRQFNKKRK